MSRIVLPAILRIKSSELAFPILDLMQGHTAACARGNAQGFLRASARIRGRP
jgi:hypothetical protein